MEEFPELLLLVVDCSFFFQGFLEMELDDGVDGLEGCLFRNNIGVVVVGVVVAGCGGVGGFVVRHGNL